MNWLAAALITLRRATRFVEVDSRSVQSSEQSKPGTVLVHHADRVDVRLSSCTGYPVALFPGHRIPTLIIILRLMLQIT